MEYSCFFLLSGAVQTYSAVKKDKKFELFSVNFVWNKLKPLYILHIIMLLLDVLLLDPIVIKQLLTNVFLVQSWIPNGSYFFAYNGVAWYLSTALVGWFLFPIIYKTINKYKTKNTAIISSCLVYFLMTIVCVIGYSIIPEIDETTNTYHWIIWLVYINPIFRLGDYVIGCNLGYLLANHVPNESENSVDGFEIIKDISGYVVLIIITFVAVYIDVNHATVIGSWWFCSSIIYIPVAVCYFIKFSRYSLLQKGKATNRVLLYIASLSPYIFLNHQVIERYLRTNILFFDKHRVMLFLVTVILSIILAELYQKLYESIFIKK